ncbi:MAG TPA: hypothetical protein VIJ16_04780 [Gemmatimonadaceae bacterium]
MHASRYAITAATAIVLSVLPTRAVRAQSAEPSVHFGATAGLNIPLSDLSRTVQTGYIMTGYAGGTPQGWPVALRGEVSYSGFSGKSGSVAQNITGVSVNAVLPLAPADEAPYFIGGIGLDHVSSYFGYSTENDMGLNLGGGYKWRVGDLSYFVELRYYYIGHTGASREMLPLTFGVTF